MYLHFRAKYGNDEEKNARKMESKVKKQRAQSKSPTISRRSLIAEDNHDYEDVTEDRAHKDKGRKKKERDEEIVDEEYSHIETFG